MERRCSHVLIDGRLVAAEGGRTYDNLNPFTELPNGPAANATAADASFAVAAARRAFDDTDWSENVAR